MTGGPGKNTERHRNLIITTDGRIADLGGTEEHATITNDGTEYEHTSIRTTTRDGYIIDPDKDVTFQCTKCASGPWSRTVMNRCTACQHYTCPACTTATPAGFVCVPCAKALRRATLIKNLLSIL